MTEGRNPANESRRVVEASAPCRVDLTGGALESWPAQPFHPGGAAVTVAIDRRVWCRVETGVDGVEIESKDTLEKLRARTVGELVHAEGAGLAARVLQALGLESGARVVTQTRVAGASRFGSRSALTVALTAAVARAVGRPLTVEQMASLCRDVEVRPGPPPPAVRGYHTAMRGGVLAFELGVGGARVIPAVVDPARVEESLVLVDAGAGSTPTTADEGRREKDGEGAVRQALQEMAAVSRQVWEALGAGRYEDLVALMTQEWEAQKRLAAGGTTAAIDGVVETVRAAGGAARVVEGAIAIWAPPGERGAARREAVVAALAAKGLRRLPLRVDLRGLEVEVVA